VSTVLVLKLKVFICLLAGAGIWFFTGLALLVLLKRNLKIGKRDSGNSKIDMGELTVASTSYSIFRNSLQNCGDAIRYTISTDDAASFVEAKSWAEDAHKGFPAM